MKIDSDFYLKLGKKIRSFRKNKKMTQREIATKLNISHQQLHKYELGENKISSSKLFIISKILKIEIDDFFLDKKEFERKKILQNFNKLNYKTKLILINFLDEI